MDRLRLMGKIRRPSRDRIKALAALEHLTLSDGEAGDIETLIDQALNMFDTIDDLPQPEVPLKYPQRDRGYRPAPSQDPYNAFVRKCLVKGAPDGKLAGKRIGLKDNIRLAGVPLTNGSTLLADFVPSCDAVAVERLLDAGALIVGKLNMDDFGFAGTSETSAFGCIRNPANPEFSAGGSSGGCGAAVASGDVDIAVAVDQGGSGRIPAAWCGVVALKPTHGLIPTYGVTYLDHTIDFISPIARTVAEVAVATEVMAGQDWRDAQWVRGSIPAASYAESLELGIRGLRVGVLQEGVVKADIEDDVLTAFEDTVASFEQFGAIIKPVSLPIWRHGQTIWNGFAVHAISVMIESNEEGYGRLGFCDIGWQQAFGDARRVRGDLFPLYLKMLMILGLYLRRDFGSIYFGKATNLRFRMRQDFDRLFEQIDVMLTPTIPKKAYRLLDHPPDANEMIQRAAGMCQNTYPTNVTGHPSLTMPCGIGEHGLPIGVQIIGRHFDEATVFRAAQAFESGRKDRRN
jgi:amidase